MSNKLKDSAKTSQSRFQDRLRPFKDKFEEKMIANIEEGLLPFENVIKEHPHLEKEIIEAARPLRILAKSMRKQLKKKQEVHEWGILGSEEGDYTVEVSNPIPSYLLPPDDENTTPYSFEQIQPLLKFLDFNQNETAELLDVDPSTITRWKKEPHKTIGKYTSRALSDIDQIIRAGIDIFGDEQHFKDWLQTSNLILGNKKPINLLKDPKGTNLVGNALAAMGWGNMM